MVSLILSNTNVKIKGNIPKGALQKIDSSMSYYIPGHQFSRNSGNSWDGRVRLLTKNGYFPIGLLSLTEKILKESGIEYEIIDNRPIISYGKQLPIIGDQKPRDYQEDAVNKAFIAGSGIIRSATGSGKALMCAMLAAKYNTDTIIYVVTKDLLYQMYKTVTETLGVECGIIGDGKCDIVKGINICTIWSAASAFGEKFKISDSEVDTDEKDIKKDNSEKLKDLVKNAKVMIVDECQYAASHTVQFLHKNSLSARHRFLLSGTPWRENGDDLLIEAVSGPKFFDLGASDLIRKGILVAPEIHMLRVPPIKNPGKTYAEIYKNYIVTNDERNDLIKSCAKKLVGLKKKTLILISKLEHGKILYESLSKEMNVEYLSGANSTDE